MHPTGRHRGYRGRYQESGELVPEDMLSGDPDEQEMDAELEYRERCMQQLADAVADCHHFLSAKDVIRLVLDAL